MDCLRFYSHFNKGSKIFYFYLFFADIVLKSCVLPCIETLRHCGLYLCLCLVFRGLEEYYRYGILVYRILFSFVLDDDSCDEGFTILHSGRHEFPFSFELPQT